MRFVQQAIILFCFLCLEFNTFSQAAGTVDFNEHIPSGCSNAPTLTIGLIADPQYCDCDAGAPRFYRETLWKLPQAIDTLNMYKVDFVITLGDLVDRYYASYDSIKPFFENLEMPFYHLLGNHEFYDISNEQMSGIVSRYNMPDYYYDFSYGNWRFLVLDGTELANYSRYVHPELAEEGDSVRNSVQGQLNDEDWNGGISKTQQLWMRSKIEEAASLEQNVIVFCHMTLYPEGIQNSLWNKETIINLLEEYPNVIAYINGHHHEGSYALKNGIHYIGQAAMLDTPDTNSFGMLKIYPKEIEIKGFGRVPDRTLQYTNFKKKTLQINLTDTTLNYSHQKNDYIGQLSYISPDTNILINYMLDTADYSNRYFSIHHDSLLLNTIEDLSLVPDLKIKVIAVDCDADTFSQTFGMVFDTTVMKFRYDLTDTIISVYSDYTLMIDSLVEDFSKFGLNFNMDAATNGIVSFTVSDDTIKIIPDKVGKTEITLTASDPFTGKNYHQVFSVEVFDPLNHAPYHSDSAKMDFIVQLNDTTMIQLDRIFIDPDGDLPDYRFEITDSGIATGWLRNDSLFLAGLKTGMTTISLNANDNRGGMDSVILNLRTNSAPFHTDTIAMNHIIQLNESLSFYFIDIFHDSDNDLLTFDFFLSDSASLGASITNDTLTVLGKKPGEVDLTLFACDSFGGIDSLRLNILINAKPKRVKEYKELIYQFTPVCDTIYLDSLFTDTDGDTIKYLVSSAMDSITLDDKNQLILCPENAGVYKIYLTLSDGKGGFGGDSIAIRFNAGPEAVQQQYQFIFATVQEQIVADLNNMFNDSNGDTLSYEISILQTDKLVFSLLANVLMMYPKVTDTIDFYVTASDNYGGNDSSMIRLVYKPEVNSLGANRLINDLNIYPNPVTGVLKIQFESIENGQVGIILSDQQGRIIYQINSLDANQGLKFYEINTESLKVKGLYILSLMLNGEYVIAKSIVVL